MKRQRCAKCDSEMEEGFVIDSTHNAVRVAKWAEGEPSYYFLKLLRMRGRRTLTVSTLRCKRCGYLESYAGAERD